MADGEPFAANTLTLSGTTLVSASAPKTAKRLLDAGIATLRLDIGEFEKIGAGLTSLSLILEARRPVAPSPRPGMRAIQVATEAPLPGHLSDAIVHSGVVYVSAPRAGSR